MQRMKTSIAVNFIYNMMYQISLVILPLITSPYLSRVIGPESIGNYSYSYSVAHYFYLFGMLGISNYGNRSISAIRENQAMVNHTFSRIYYFQVIVSGISTIAYLFYCICICNANVSLALAQVFYVLSSTLSVNWFFFRRCASCSAFFSSTLLCAFSIKVTTSPIPKIREAILSG